MFDFSGLGTIDLGTVIALVSLIGTSIVWLLDRYFWRRKRLVYRVQVDAQIGVHPQQNRAREVVDIEVVHQGTAVQEPSIVLLRVDNTGTDIDARDMQGKVEFSFPDRKIVRLKVVESHPPKLGAMIEKDMNPAGYVDQDTLVLPSSRSTTATTSSSFWCCPGGARASHTPVISPAGRTVASTTSPGRADQVDVP